jgi:hypothetical protein
MVLIDARVDTSSGQTVVEPDSNCPHIDGEGSHRLERQAGWNDKPAGTTRLKDPPGRYMWTHTALTTETRNFYGSLAVIGSDSLQIARGN